jgi:hypothetical protein
MTVSAANIVPPMLTAAEIVVLFFASMTPKTGLRSLLRRLVLKGNDLLWVAFFKVGPAWAMTRLAACHLALPAINFGKLRVGSVGERFELLFVAVFARFTSYIISRIVSCRFDLARLG